MILVTSTICKAFLFKPSRLVCYVSSFSFLLWSIINRPHGLQECGCLYTCKWMRALLMKETEGRVELGFINYLCLFCFWVYHKSIHSVPASWLTSPTQWCDMVVSLWKASLWLPLVGEIAHRTLWIYSQNIYPSVNNAPFPERVWRLYSQDQETNTSTKYLAAALNLTEKLNKYLPFESKWIRFKTFQPQTNHTPS